MPECSGWIACGRDMIVAMWPLLTLWAVALVFTGLLSLLGKRPHQRSSSDALQSDRLDEEV
jgi:hypothetical protein